MTFLDRDSVSSPGSDVVEQEAYEIEAYYMDGLVGGVIEERISRSCVVLREGMGKLVPNFEAFSDGNEIAR